MWVDTLSVFPLYTYTVRAPKEDDARLSVTLYYLERPGPHTQDFFEVHTSDGATKSLGTIQNHLKSPSSNDYFVLTLPTDAHQEL